MYEYFPNHYSWNLGLLMALQLGGEMTEIDEACRPLIEVAQRPDAKDDPQAQQLWLAQWKTLGDKVEAFARLDEKQGHRFSAGRKYLRACVYYMTAERMAGHKDPQKLEIYGKLLETFRKGVTLRDVPLEFVDIPYGNTTLPALFHRAPGDGRKPAMIHFDGFDVVKEWMFLCGIAEEFARRGISTLMVDHPGVGAALRLQGLPTSPESERWATASMDYLETRNDVDASRVGIIAMSLGGYYAPRAAAFEKRLAACVAWGARFENASSHGRILRDPNAARSVTGWVDHALWVYGANDKEDAARKIDAMTLAPVIEKITCPILVLHGENDRQVPLDQAQKTIDGAINSPRRDLRILTAAEGGVEHCQGDLFASGIDIMTDWVADVFRDAAGLRAAKTGFTTKPE
jgi:dienelactone hydrolase